MLEINLKHISHLKNKKEDASAIHNNAWVYHVCFLLAIITYTNIISYTNIEIYLLFPQFLIFSVISLSSSFQVLNSGRA